MNTQWIFIFILCFLGLNSAAHAAQKRIYELNANKVAEYIEGSVGKKRVIMMYTSWCPHCRNAMPFMMEIEQTEPGSVIAISRDDSIDALAKYIKTLDEIPFDVIMSRENEDRAVLNRKLAKFGVKPWNGFPHYILLNEKNRVVEQGNYHGQVLVDFLLGKYP